MVKCAEISRKKKNMSEYIPQREILTELSLTFSAFADETRLKIICALSFSEMCVSELSYNLSINQTTVSHQLRYLKNAMIVDCRREGKTIYYYLRNDMVNDILFKGMEFLAE